MESHVKVVGIVHVIWSSIGLAVSLLVMLVFGGVTEFILTHFFSGADQAVLQTIAFCLSLLLGTIVVCALIGLVASISVMSYQNWARWLLVVLSALQLFAFPVGTVIGGYTLWVLLDGETARLFDAANMRDAPTPEHLRL